MAEPIGLMEKFALAEDREAILAELIPGSEDHFFFHCLHYQNTGQLDLAEATLKNWLAHHKGRENAAITSMLDRQRLLGYRDSPERTIDHLIKRLGVQLDHAPPAVQGERRYPSELDQDKIRINTFLKRALSRNNPLKPIGMQHLADLFRQDKTAEISINLHDYLKRVDGPYIRNLAELVIKELKGRREKELKFGDLSAHQFLTLAELERVRKEVPQVADDQLFVQAWLQRLRPDGDKDLSQQSEVRMQYLQRVHDYVSTLAASHNSLKACATYRLLEAKAITGEFDRELFIRYLQLPRKSPIVHLVWAKRPNPKANLGDGFMAIAMLSPIVDEERLVRAHLEHFLVDANDTNEFAEYLKPEYLRRVFAETKLFACKGDLKQWYDLLSASEQKQVRDAVQLRLADQNKLHFSADDPTELIVDIKNINDLIVRVYEINTLAYFQTHQKPLDTDIDLDGLVATFEKRYTYDLPAVQRHRETIALDEITGRGVWIVDLVAKGVRARAMIRRGDIHHVTSANANGMVFTIVDENQQAIPGAKMVVASQELVADEVGRIVLPPITKQVRRTATIFDGKLAKQVAFNHQKENYSLSAGMHVDRTLLQSGGPGKLLIRPRLMMGDQIVDPSMLKEISVLIKATDMESVDTTVQLDNLEFDQKEELVIPFRVPPRLAGMSVVLSGSIAGIADGRERKLNTSRSWSVAGIRTTSHTRDLFLTCDGEDYMIEVRGRSGEPIQGETVAVSFTSNCCNAQIEETLQSDDAGIIKLGSLSGVTKIGYHIQSGMHHERDLRLGRVNWPNEVHTTANKEVRLPLAEDIVDPQQRFRLLEVRGDQYYDDISENLSAVEGFLATKVLSAGDYKLVDLKSGQETEIVVVDGPEHGSVAVGAVRHQSLTPNNPLGIETIEQGEKGLAIKLSGDTRFARVHLVAKRYWDAVDAFDQFSLPNPVLYGRGVSIQRSGYISDLRLGDEYQYVLRRRYAAKYPGVMLPQPSVILNPWETEETINQSQDAAPGEPMAASAPSASKRKSRNSMGRQQAAANSVASDYDFVADPGVLVTNLVPDELGVVQVPADVLEGLPLIQVVVCDPATVLQRTVRSQWQDVETKDLRLADALDAKSALTFERAVTVVSKDEPLDLSSLGSAQVQVYGSVDALFKFYKTLVTDDRLNDFDAFAFWSRFDQATKVDYYAQLASHELHLFLWSHDREFFDRVVRPYLANKKEKWFVDDWLLENDLSKYTKIWRYNELNAAERAMLSMRMPEESRAIRREFDNRVAKQDVNHAVIRQQIEHALAKSGLLADGLVTRALGETDDVALSFSAVDGVADLSVAGVVAGKRMDRLSRSSKVENESKKLSRRLLERGGEVWDSRTNDFDDDEYTTFFQELDSTKQWAESNWDRVRTVGHSNPEDLISVNPFWKDIADGDANNVRVSKHLLRPVDTRHSVLTALAFCGLPLKPGKIGLPSEADQSYAPEHPVAVVIKRLTSLEPSDQESGVLVGQQFASLNASNKKKFVEPKEFLTNQGYRGQIVVSNPTAERQAVDVFWQIPAGSVALSGSQVTDSRAVTLEPFAVQAIEYQFCFPQAGDFVHYPATVAAEGKLIARGSEKSFNVVVQATENDTVTWEKIARTGTPDQIKQFLSEANLRDMDWLLVAHRMHEPEIYRCIVDVLDSENLDVQELWAYSLKHRDEPAMQQYLGLQEDLVSSVGPNLESPLLDVEPIGRRTHELLEYSPLVRARIHRLGAENEILNPTFLRQYQSFVQTLGYRKQMPPQEEVVLSYYLLLQNRIEEAIDRFAKIDRESQTEKLQYDYLAAYLAMHREAFDEAAAIATRYESYPIPRWNDRFTQLASQLGQRQALMETEQFVSVEKDSGDAKPIAQGSGDLALLDRDRRQAAASDVQPKVVVRVEGDALRIDHQRAKEVTLNLYGVDLELLFSKAPFVREDLARMAMVRPQKTEILRFEQSDGIGKYDLKEDLRRQTLLVEVIAGASRSTALYYGGEITTYVSEGFGQLQTTDAKSHRPISAAYVKVYAKYPDGSIKFYKDGYTDLRGRFDYASISASNARGATRFAILVISDEKGATLHDVSTPND